MSPYNKEWKSFWSLTKTNCEDKLHAYWVNKIVQCQHKGWVDWHFKLRFLNVCTPVLLFNTKSSLLPGKLKLRWIGPFWIVQKFGDNTFLLGQIDGTINPKAVNGYWLKPYFGQMPPCPFTEADSSASFFKTSSTSQFILCSTRHFNFWYFYFSFFKF